MRQTLWMIAAALLLLVAMGCGDDDGGTEADRAGVAAQCSADEDCAETAPNCLAQFKGGYCGIAGCQSDADCPDASACVAHSDGQNYCFRLCTNKADCNRNRSAEWEANCSSSVDFIDPAQTAKACVPPSN